MSDELLSLVVDWTKVITFDQVRAAIVNEARSWIGTPYHLRSRIKGAGADCGSFLIGVFQNVGMIGQEVEPPNYPENWWQNVSDERYKFAMMKYAHSIVEGVAYRLGVLKPSKDIAFAITPQPGDVVLSRAAGSRVYNHAGIVTQWPRLVHAVTPCVEECDATTHALWALKEVAVFDLVKP
jgi:cell wall-associated NlpC family hydrolase